jgi:PhnB protein
MQGVAQAIEFYKTAFGAQERCRLSTPDGKSVLHASLSIGDSATMLSDESPTGAPRVPTILI